jgi:hypothetical protein
MFESTLSLNYTRLRLFLELMVQQRRVRSGCSHSVASERDERLHQRDLDQRLVRTDRDRHSKSALTVTL